MKFTEIPAPTKGEPIRASRVADIIAAGKELTDDLDELERALDEAEGKRGRRGFRGRPGLVQPVPPPMLQPAGVELLTVPQLDRYRELLTALGCTVPTLSGLDTSALFALYAADLPTLCGSALASAEISPAEATWELVQLTPGTTYTLTRSSAAGKYTPTAPMGGEPLAVLMGTDSGTTTTTQTLVEGDATGSGDVATLTDCPIAQIRWAELGEGSGLYQPLVIPMYIPLF